ncbi:hypothetical protein M0R88_03115 [Halorussus gelatinilyticus]|uniref:Uncharacterized protein n=1 Tax=Halorussus gelatinilyticus TaxID=2937524 RepID=A0A8U0IJ24_9EURY|nr:hypothetical protein [Halorussus gelatinilyticus]UPW01100.1 hypothetical protein M0R88_03115 [Halorussus gelatinilyticus]
MAEEHSDTRREYWFDEYEITQDTRECLVDIEEDLTEEIIRDIASANPYDWDALLENKTFIGVYIGDWTPYFDDFGIEDYAIRDQVMDIHEREGVFSLDMDRQQPLYFLITRKGE